MVNGVNGVETPWRDSWERFRLRTFGWASRWAKRWARLVLQSVREWAVLRMHVCVRACMCVSM